MSTQPSVPPHECYGKLFPPVLTLAHNAKVEGQVFGYVVNHPGLIPIGRSVAINSDAWRQCAGCPDFDGCYRLSMGTVLMEMALRG